MRRDIRKLSFDDLHSHIKKCVTRAKKTGKVDFEGVMIDNGVANLHKDYQRLSAIVPIIEWSQSQNLAIEVFEELEKE